MSQVRRRSESVDVALDEAEKRMVQALQAKLGSPSMGGMFREWALKQCAIEGIVDPGPATPANLEGTLLEAIAA